MASPALPAKIERMFKTIVLATDGSPGAARAEEVAVELARQSGARLVLAHVDERIAAKGDLPPVRGDEEAVQDEIRAKVAALSTGGLDAVAEFESAVLGGPGRGLAEIAARVDADLIVAGTRGRSSLAGIAVGSVSHRLIHICRCPVLVVPSA